ncbi:hypothetical protein [Pseudodonghicola xiamenensis]|uniref:Uncharacterized protein n=1 Tax=Pseudodonghicola xiamenensis TaxID=337702 RepID=A0A8J3HDQ1_9RHOB|nr:hypothetical protein [Pseudodonghicola xiamenensis]GHH05383.1 hypothetical protein GCM10010961_44210 [Pseudodonghicola xiamenensis]
MKLVTHFEAAFRTTDELHVLLREALNAFAAAPRGSTERQNALHTMQNIAPELAARASSLT